jgi:hypothetical protein
LSIVATETHLSQVVFIPSLAEEDVESLADVTAGPMPSDILRKISEILGV